MHHGACYVIDLIFFFSCHTAYSFSTSLLHRTVEDSYLGRVFATEMALVTFILSLSTYCTGLALDAGVGPRSVVMVLAGMFMVPGCFWTVYLRKRQKEKGKR